MPITIIDKFEPIRYGTTRYYIVTGGRGSSKSYSVSTILVGLMREEAKQVILYTRYTLTSAHISIIPEFQEKLKLLGWEHLFDITKTEITCKQNGSKIIFRGIQTSSGNQTANLKSIQGITTWVLDEAEELTDQDTFDKIDESIRQVGMQNRVILILNPVTSAHWIYKRFFESGRLQNTTYIHTTYLDNKENLSESFIEKAEQLRDTNPVKYNHRFMGEWLTSAEGVVFENWQEGDTDTDLPIIYGQDYGFSNDPTTLVQVRFDKQNMKLYLKELIYKTRLTTNEIILINREYTRGGLIIGDSAEPRLIEEMRIAGINIKPAEKGQGSVSVGLLGMQDWTLIVHPESYNLKKELNNYIWLDKGSKLVIDDYNHLIDAIRYAFTYYTKPKIENFVI